MEAEPLVDERYTKADSMTAALKENVDNSYSISITLDMEDLTRAGYKYTQPVAGDYIMAINETLGFKEKIRIVSFTSEYDVTGQLVKHEVTCNDIGAVKKLSASYTLAKEQAQNASDSVVKAVEMANKALVSADGKNTVYFGTEFPEDEPKGTLHKGDSLYLTVGDTTKMYYWTGADWEELPIVNDVEAFKEQIAEELKDVPDREEFEATITEKLATSKAELETQIDTAKTQAESNAKAYADEINQATAEVAEQANTTANSLKSDLAKVKIDLTATTSTANDAKTSASEAKQQLTAVANDLSTAKQDLQAQASQLTAQASAQSELTKRVSTVEETANGTKTTVSELSKTVDSNTKNITSVTARTKTVEADLASTKTTLSQIKITADNTSKKTATLETSLNGVKTDLTATTTTANTTKTNLANYQASNDKLVANLQSNLQTTNGNVSSLKTKVEAVPGQISSAISTVEGKLEAIDQLNLIGAFNLTPQNATFDKTDYTLTSTTTTNTKDGFLQLQFYDAKNVVFTGFGLADKVGKFAKSFKITKAYEKFRIKINGNASDASVWCYDKDLIKLNTDYVLSGEVLSLSSDGRGNGGQIKHLKIQEGKMATGFSKSPEDVDSDISKVTSEIKQTADGMTLLATKTELNSAKTELQSGITTATNKANAAQNTANSNAQTISTHTTQISALNTGLKAKVSQTDFNTLSGRVTTAENNITAKANELSSKITSVEGKIPTSIGGTNLVRGTANFSSGWTWNTKVATVTDIIDDFNVYHSTSTGTNTASNNYDIRFDNALTVLPGTEYTLSFWAKGSGTIYSHFFPSCVAHGVNSDGKTTTAADGSITHTLKSDWERYWVTWKTLPTVSGLKSLIPCRQPAVFKSEVWLYGVKLERGSVPTDWSPAPEDYDSKLAAAQSEIKQTTDSITASVSSVQTAASNAQSTANTAVSKADAAQAGVNTLDSTTVKSASLTINADGIVMKAGKSTTDVANAIGSYFAVNQNAINLFSDKINIKGSMIVDGAITSTKIASKSINTAHLNGKIITADVISTGAITANAIKAGAVTTSAMSANSINGDRITAGTLDAAKIKAGSITASQIASGTITSSQIKTGGISAANIAAGAITTDKIAANSINSDKIVTSGITANVIKGGKLQSLSNATNFELDTGKLFYNNNNTGIFRVQANASTMGLKFSNTSITVSGTSRILSRVILGGDRRETTLDDGKWDQGGFSGIVIETINGITSNVHEKADSLRIISDNIYFTHTYNNDSASNVSASGWKMETYPPTSTYPSHVVLRPYGISYRNADIITGDVRLDNGDGSGYYVRSCIQILRNCFQHIINGGTSSNAINAIRSAISQISGV